MARGFESKAVTDQQESAEARVSDGPELPVDGPRVARLKRLQLARVDVARRMDNAVAPGHRELLERTLAAIDEELEHSG